MSITGSSSFTIDGTGARNLGYDSSDDEGIGKSRPSRANSLKKAADVFKSLKEYPNIRLADVHRQKGFLEAVKSLVGDSERVNQDGKVVGTLIKTQEEVYLGLFKITGIRDDELKCGLTKKAQELLGYKQPTLTQHSL